MKLEGERIIQAGRAAVWEGLNDPEVLRACIPGCEELERTSPTTFEGQVTQKVGPVKARFRGTVTLGNVVEAESYTITGEGKGGAAGFVKGGADVSLSDAEDGSTRLAFDAEAQVGGKLAQLGNRVVQGYARKVTDQFFDRFKEEIERPASEDSVTPAVDQAPDELVAAEASPSVVADETEDATIREHPLEKPGSAGPTTREEPISGASGEAGGQGIEEPPDDPEATSAGAGPAGNVDAPHQAAISKAAADMAAAEDSDEPRPGLEDDPAEAPAERPASASTDGAKGGAGTDPARVAGTGASDQAPPRGRQPEGPKTSAREVEAGTGQGAGESGKKKSWFQRLFGG